MVIYTIEKGEYSDYAVVKLFLNKEKAEEYVKYHPGTSIRARNTDDDSYILPTKRYWRADLTFNIYRNNGKYKMEEDVKARFIQREAIDDPSNDIYQDAVLVHRGNPFIKSREEVFIELWVQKKYPEDMFENEEAVYQKVKKIAEDIATQIEAFIEQDCNGEFDYRAVDDRVEEWFNGALTKDYEYKGV